ncbi:MAG: translation initiation factor IF-2 [Bacteroidales bacterium]|nr:translation initiation factor IF-2 [Bacteroidales bacterium]
MTGNPIRLTKAAQEFNVGTSTIVEFLEKKGHRLENKENPNTKIPEDLYQLLVVEFRRDRETKLGAEKINVSNLRNQKTITIADKPKKVAIDNEIKWKTSTLSDNLIIRETTLSKTPVVQPKSGETASGKTETDKKAPPVKEPAVVEKITSATAKETKPKKETAPPKEVAPKEVSPKELPKKAVEEPVTLAQPKESEPVVETKPEVTEIKAPKRKAEKAAPTSSPERGDAIATETTTEMPKPETAVAETPKPEVKIEPPKPEETTPETPKPETAPETPKPEPVAETPKPETTETQKPETAPETPKPEALPETPKPKTAAGKLKSEPEKVETKIPKIGITVVDHIDVDTLEFRPPPKKKSSSERKKEKAKRRREREAAAKAQQAAEAATVKKEETVTTAPATPQEQKIEKPEDNVIRVKAPLIQGPKIITTIDLSQFERKPVASSSDDLTKKRNKKKRNRIESGKKPPEKSAEQQKRQDQQRQKKQDQPSQPDQTKKEPKVYKKKPPRLEIKVAPSEEEIKKQISDTLSKLTTTSKSKASKHRKEKREGIREKMAVEAQKAAEELNILKVTEFLTANELASMMNVPVTDVIKKCMDIGLFVSINQRLDAETVVFIADEFGYQVTFIDAEEQESKQEEDMDDAEDLLPRHPVVTVMGHVDHGKTKLLDYIRHANVVAGEAGGITQHIGAYSVTLDDGRKITFLDTPGHEAFTAMRARGAKMTDVAIIVIAADDDVMPQTKEAINHAQAANVPIVIAINKIDKPTADPEKIRKQLAELNILVEEWGGKYQCQEISAKQGINVDLLLEKVLLEAEMLELTANPDKLAKGSVIESKLEPGRGYVASILVQSGTLKKGDVVLAGQYFGRVKALFNERYQLIDTVPPATPALILGLNGAPQAGDNFTVMKEEREARILATKRQQLQREIGLRTQKHITLDDIGRNIARGSFKELNIIVKGDVDGSVEALSDSLLKLTSDEVKVNVIHKSVGAIIESDVLLASASNAVIVGFQVRPSVSARRLAETEEIDIRLYSIIYNAIEEIQSAIEGMLAPEIKEDITCNVEVREIFKIHKTGTVAGCLVLDGVITRDAKVRIIRDGIVVYTGLLGSLKRYKDDVKEVRSGIECGLNIVNFNDIKVGDIIEGYKETEVKRSL